MLKIRIIAGALLAERKRKSSLHLLLHSSWMADMLKLVTPARKSVETHLCCCRSFLTRPSTGCDRRRRPWIWLNYVFVRDVMKFIFLVMCFMSRGALVWKFGPSPGIQDAVSSSHVSLSLSGIGLNWGQGKFGPQCWFIIAGTRTFLGTTRHLLVFQVFGTASVGEVQYQGISSLWRWFQSSLRGLFTSKERPPVSMWSLCENPRE